MEYPIYKEYGFDYYKVLSPFRFVGVEFIDILDEYLIELQTNEDWCKKLIENGRGITEKQFLDAFAEADKEIKQRIYPEGIKTENPY